MKNEYNENMNNNYYMQEDLSNNYSMDGYNMESR